VKEAGLQNPVLTDRNGIRGHIERVSKHIIVKPLTNKLIVVDAAGIGGRNMSLPGEVFVVTSWQSKEVSRGHSSNRKRAPINREVSQGGEGLNVTKFPIKQGG